jgi:uncharacterized protein YndB with AHSA1/START domain
MEQQERTIITVNTTVNSPITKVWEAWTRPEHITHWAFASDDWYSPKATNDLKVGGNFSTTMAAKDGSVSFDFSGTYTDVQSERFLAYLADDGRRVEIIFSSNGDQTEISEAFEAEDINTIELQQGGWQAIMDNFKKYTESLS